MIIDLPDTTSVGISRTLVDVRNQSGAMALGRVLTLLIPVEDGTVDAALKVAGDASRQHPCRIVTIVRGDRRGKNRLDAQIRLGGDAGASEIVILRLYGALAGHAESVATPLLLADSPVLAWWPGPAPKDVHEDPIGAMAGRRITDSAASPNPTAALRQRAATYEPGDTDLAWTRLTRWRSVLASALDQPPFESVTGITVAGSSDSPSTDLLAAWLQLRLKAPASRVRTSPGSGILSVRLERASGPIDLVRPGGAVATLSEGGHPDRRLALARRTDAECLADELRRLDRDEPYEHALLKGLPALSPARKTPGQAIKQGETPSIAKAKSLARKIARQQAVGRPGGMVTELPAAPPSTAKPSNAKPSDDDSGDVVRTATAKKLAGKATPREEELLQTGRLTRAKVARTRPTKKAVEATLGAADASVK